MEVYAIDATPVGGHDWLLPELPWFVPVANTSPMGQPIELAIILDFGSDNVELAMILPQKFPAAENLYCWLYCMHHGIYLTDSAGILVL
ncbi:hypothetical protein FH972_005991 [Carpinus fangiana]|uniref:Uncharacterized protein n=1 Tax=Carpinus fangiana TaxID=176857 RepID=A0A5N6QTA7_9ROSI|nr:hypothetical protein FH972_005991 [Carpinus fangiana]